MIAWKTQGAATDPVRSCGVPETPSPRGRPAAGDVQRRSGPPRSAAVLELENPTYVSSRNWQIRREFKPGLENIVAGFIIGLLLIGGGVPDFTFRSKG